MWVKHHTGIFWAIGTVILDLTSTDKKTEGNPPNRPHRSRVVRSRADCSEDLASYLRLQPFPLKMEAGEYDRLGYQIEPDHDPDSGERNPFGL